MRSWRIISITVCSLPSPGHGDSRVEVRATGSVMSGDDPSPDDLSSPNPDLGAPLLQAQQRPSSGHDRETAAADKQDREDVEQADAGREDADEGLPPSKGSDPESEEEEKGEEEDDNEEKQHQDPNNNCLETPEDCQEALPPPHPALVQERPLEETYCSDEIAVVLVDTSGPPSARLEESDTVKIIITMSCDAQTAAELEESVKQSILESAQAHAQRGGDHQGGGPNTGDCHIRIPVITFDSPEEEGEGEGEGKSVSETNPSQQALTSLDVELSKDLVSSDVLQLDQEYLSPQLTNENNPSSQLTNENSSSGIDVHSHNEENDPPELNMDANGFLRIPPALGRYCLGPGGRTHVRGLSMDSGKDAVLLVDRAQNKNQHPTMTSSKSDLEEIGRAHV